MEVNVLRKTLTVAAASAALTLGATAPADAEIRIGSFLSLSGPASFLGDPEEKTLEMYVERINENGGVNGEQIELIVYDDGGKAVQARTFATRLIEDDQVDAIIGGSTTGATMAVVPMVNNAEIPFISLAGGVPIIDPVKPYVFKTPHTDRMACEKIFRDMQDRGITQIGMISGTGGFGSSMREQCLDVSGKYDIDVVADETYGQGDSDMTPQLTSIRGTDGVQAILNAGFGQGPAIVTSNHDQLGIELPLYQSHGVASDSFLDLAGAAANGLRLPSPSLLVADQIPQDDPQYDVVNKYKSEYEARYDEPVSTFGGYAYDALFMLVDAIERAGSKDGTAIRDALEQTSGFIGTTGEFNLSDSDHLGLDVSAFRMVEVRDQSWHLLER
jgi:branched-chain amino acid transport system substrate-binding protein